MKKSNLLLNLLLAIVLIGGMTACNDDDPGLEEKEGIDVAPGYYMAMEGEDPVAGAVLTAANLDGSGIGSLERPGFLQGYMYLEAGNYNLVEIVDKQVAETRGGTLTTVSGEDAHNEECGGADNTEYHVVANSQVDGAAFAVPVDGFYVVAYDGFADGTNDIVFDQITSVGIIGDATPGGWGEDTPMAMTMAISADGFMAEATGVTLDEASMKYRFNCRWAIDRRLDHGEDFSNDNGYSFWTNFGGSLSGTDVTLVPGNDAGNIAISEYAEYTVTFGWDPIEGFSATVTKTGAAEPKPEFPEAMYATGDATAYGWPSNNDPEAAENAAMNTLAGGVDGVFYKILHLEGGGGFKLTAAAWGNPNLGFNEVDEFDADGVEVTDNGGNMSVATSGMYTVVLDLRDNMTKVSVRNAEVYGIGGDGFAFPTDPAWTAGFAGTKFTVDDAAKTITSPAASAGDIRSFVSHPWISGADLSNWWHAEFKPIDGVINYRTGDELAASNATAGQVVVYTFDSNSATIN